MKRIVICADGTWNNRDQVDPATGKRRPTNVTKLARAVRPRTCRGVDQVVFYLDGVGTRGPLDSVTGGAFGHGIERNVRDLYRSIVYNYEAGDELFLFGFSRGAFTVRTLAGFMGKVGLIDKDDDYFLPEIYACYERNCTPGSREWKKAFRRVGVVRPCPPIKLIGVWDTVGALGAPGLIGRIARNLGANKYEYHDVGLHAAIENAYQALAIDERRAPFKPNLWKRPDGWTGNLEQAWFPGVHRDVGGSYSPDGLANEALHWIVEKAESHGLEVDDAYLDHFRPFFSSRLHESMSVRYRILGVNVRPIGAEPAGAERVHQTAIDRRHLFAGYRPKNLEAFLASAGPGLVYAQTTRVVRGHAILKRARANTGLDGVTLEVGAGLPARELVSDRGFAADQPVEALDQKQ
jgi:uncharacterized protein (DUF2235 family)